MSEIQPRFVYAFTMRLPGIDHAYTKIGVTSDPERRFYEINRAVPGALSVDFIVLGDEQREATLHAMCEAKAIGNEWFWPLDLTLIIELLSSEIVEMQILFPDMNWSSLFHRQIAEYYIGEAIRMVDELHKVKPNQEARDMVVMLLQEAGGLLW